MNYFNVKVTLISKKLVSKFRLNSKVHSNLHGVKLYKLFNIYILGGARLQIRCVIRTVYINNDSC